MSSFVKGKYKRNIYQTNTGYVVGLFHVNDASDDFSSYVDKTITFTGYFHELNDMDTYQFFGSMVEHSKYGLQFQVDSYERCKPEDKDAIVDFLSSGLFKGIGTGKAKKIVDVLGKDTLNTILDNPSNLVLIPGITEKDSNNLHNKLLEYEESYNIIIKLNDIGFNTKEAMLIYNKYRSGSIDVVSSNIYQILDDIDKFSFKRIDYLALNNSISVDDINRIEASIIYAISEVSNSYGHSYYFLEEIKPLITRILKYTISDELYDEAIKNLLNDGKLVKLGDKYYLRKMYDAECFIVNRINILQHMDDNKVDDIKGYLQKIEGYFNTCYNSDQENAIINSYLKNFLIITGGPGTGKTTIMRAICELYNEINKLSYDKLRDNIALLAPTGRAAKRMSEATNLPSSTIHRFLKWNKDNNKFQVNEYNKSKVSFVLVDEASMIDTYLFSSLLKGLSINTKIVLVGDVEQLPSVGPGQVLSDLIGSNMLNVCCLNTLYRQKEGSNIISLAHYIKNNQLDMQIFNKEDDLTFIECDNDSIISKIEEICKTYSDYSYKKIQILAPMYKTINGIDSINIYLQDVFNPKKNTKKEILIGDVLYREGDKVIQLTNMPDDNVYNGDIGIIEKIVSKNKKEVYIDFDGDLVKYTPTGFLNFKKAYAISIHKAQGSEFDIVIIPLAKSFNKMLYRKLIYTAITRCKKKLFLIGDISCLEYAIHNTVTDIRRTSIKDFLINGIK